MAGDRTAFLIKLLRHKKPEVRKSAAIELGVSRAANATTALVRALEDESELVRQSVAWSLGMIGDARAVEGLKKAMRDDHGWVREKAAWSLGMIGDATSIDVLTESLSDEYWEVRKFAAWALGLLSDERSLDALSALLSDKDEGVRRAAAESVFKISTKSPRALAQTAPVLARRMSLEDACARRDAVESTVSALKLYCFEALRAGNLDDALDKTLEVIEIAIEGRGCTGKFVVELCTLGSDMFAQALPIELSGGFKQRLQKLRCANLDSDVTAKVALEEIAVALRNLKKIRQR